VKKKSSKTRGSRRKESVNSTSSPRSRKSKVPPVIPEGKVLKREKDDKKVLKREKDDSNDFSCPITKEIMTDPVLAPDGYSYERESIVMWLSQNGTSPVTRQTMTVEELVDNTELKAKITKSDLRIQPLQESDNDE